MADDRSYVEVNARNVSAYAPSSSGWTMTSPANEYWTIAGVLGHLAHWDSRVLIFAQKIDPGEPWVPTDAEPDGDWVTDSARPLIHAIAPRAAAELAQRMAEETDARVAELPLERMAPRDPDSPLYPARGEHRGEHSTRYRLNCGTAAVSHRGSLRAAPSADAFDSQ